MDNSRPKAQDVIKDNSNVWINQETLDIVFTFTCKGGMGHAFTMMGHSLD